MKFLRLGLVGATLFATLSFAAAQSPAPNNSNTMESDGGPAGASQRYSKGANSTNSPAPAPTGTSNQTGSEGGGAMNKGMATTPPSGPANGSSR